MNYLASIETVFSHYFRGFITDPADTRRIIEVLHALKTPTLGAPLSQGLGASILRESYTFQDSQDVLGILELAQDNGYGDLAHCWATYPRDHATPSEVRSLRTALVGHIWKRHPLLAEYMTHFCREGWLCLESHIVVQLYGTGHAATLLQLCRHGLLDHEGGLTWGGPQGGIYPTFRDVTPAPAMPSWAARARWCSMLVVAEERNAQPLRQGGEFPITTLEDEVVVPYTEWLACSPQEVLPAPPEVAPEATPEVAPEEVPTPTVVHSKLRRPWGRADELTTWDLEDPHIRSYWGVVELVTGGYAMAADTYSCAVFDESGTFHLGKYLSDEHDSYATAYYHDREAGSLTIFSGVPNPDRYITHTYEGTTHSYPNDGRSLNMVYNIITGENEMFADAFCRDYPRYFSTYYDPSGRCSYYCRCDHTIADERVLRRRGIVRRSVAGSYASNEYVHVRRCFTCGADHSQHNFNAEHEQAVRIRTMDTVQHYNGHSNIVVHDDLRPRALSRYTVGFEVEKNSITNLDGSMAYDRGDYVDRTQLFSRWERDGSCGVEGITHAYSVERYALFRSHVVKANHLLEGDTNTLRNPDRESDSRRRYTCGGHVTLNGPKVSMASVRLYSGLLYALYKKRLRNGFCSDNKDMMNSGRQLHYCAIRERGARSVEFRLVRRVETYKNLLWRFRLFRTLAKAIHEELSFEEYLRLNRPLLREVYSPNRRRDVIADARHFNDYLCRGVIHSSIAEFI